MSGDLGSHFLDGRSGVDDLYGTDELPPIQPFPNGIFQAEDVSDAVSVARPIRRWGSGYGRRGGPGRDRCRFGGRSCPPSGRCAVDAAASRPSPTSGDPLFHDQLPATSRTKVVLGGQGGGQGPSRSVLIQLRERVRERSACVAVA